MGTIEAGEIPPRVAEMPQGPTSILERRESFPPYSSAVKAVQPQPVGVHAPLVGSPRFGLRRRGARRGGRCAAE